MKQATRALRILKMLQSGRPIKRTEFLERLGISAATFKRDIDALRHEQNAPIIWDAAQRAYTLSPPANATVRREAIPGTWFDREELLALVAIQQILDQIEPRLLQDVLHPLRERAASLLAGSGLAGARLEQALTRIKVLPMQRRTVDDGLFECIVTALIGRKQITVNYTNRQTREATPRTISPQRIVCYRDNWYLDAWCHLRNALRTFSLDTLSAARITEQAATEFDAATLDQHFASSYGIFSGSATHTATLRFSKSVAGWIEREQWHPQQTITVLNNGEIELTVPYANATELVRDILKWGPDVEVIAPATLRDQVGDAVQATAKRYF